MSNRTVYLRVCVIEEIPTRKAEESIEEIVDGFEIEFDDVRDARRELRRASDALRAHEQEDIMDDGSDDDRDDDREPDIDIEQLMTNVTSQVKKVLRKKLR